MKKILTILFLALIAIIIFVYPLGILKDNETFCSKYIPQMVTTLKI